MVILKPVSKTKIFNFSSRKLTAEEEALSFGLKYSFNPLKLNYTEFFLAFEKLFRTLKNEEIYNSTVDSINHVRSTLKNLALKTYYSFKPELSSFHKSVMSTIKHLASDKSLIVTKPDKGSGVVLIDRNTYIQKMNDVLSDVS